MAIPDYAPASNPFSAGDDFPSTDGSVTLPGGVDAVMADYVHAVDAEHEIRVVTSWSGKEKRSLKKPARTRFKITFAQLTPTDADTLWHHFLAQTGTLSQFTYYDYLSGESFTVRYETPTMSRETFLFEAERVGVTLIEVL
jgi:hypothetical protein